MSGPTDLVLVLPSVVLPAAPPAPASKEAEAEGEEGGEQATEAPPTLEIALVDAASGDVLGALPLAALEHAAEHTYAAARSLKGLSGPSVCIKVLGADGAPLYSSPPLSELEEALGAARAEAAQAKADAAGNADELKAAAAALAAVSPVGGMAGALFEMQLAPAEEGGEGALLTCDWRLQRALPTVGQELSGAPTKISTSEMRGAAYRSTPAQLYHSEQRFRPRPLAMRYSAPKDIIEFEVRLNSWRSELQDNLKVRTVVGDLEDPGSWPPYAAAAALEINTIPSAAPRSAARGGICQFPPSEWSEKWRAPYVPHHMRGDARTLAAKQDYIENCESYRLLFHRQKISVELAELQKELQSGRIGYKNALQGLSMIRRMRSFLEEPRDVRAEGKADVIRVVNLRQADPATLAGLSKTLKWIKLPFELLVPDLEYEGEKASLIKMMDKEVERRNAKEKAAAAALASKPSEADTLRVPGVPLPTFKKESGGALPRTRPISVGWGRSGVLSFRGYKAPKPEKEKIWEIKTQ